MVVRANFIFALEKGIKLEVNKKGPKPAVLMGLNNFRGRQRPRWERTMKPNDFLTLTGPGLVYIENQYTDQVGQQKWVDRSFLKWA